ncbi:syndecan isoform X1 [Choristoneura fumiferana]|uniref:syndecan isoform X1 n=2 Tax=Choristoneura fumiferana TaxID=7141 RepID=UPI003D15EDE6
MHLRIYLWLSCVVLAGYVRATEDATEESPVKVPVPLASDRDLFIDDDGSGLEIDESSGSGWGPGPGPDDEDGRGSGDAPPDDEDFSPRILSFTSTTTTTSTTTQEPQTTPFVETPTVDLYHTGTEQKPAPEEPRGAGEDTPSRPEPDISISGEDANQGTNQDPLGTNVGAESRPVDNVVFIMNAKPEDRATSFFAQPGILAAVIGGAVVGLLCAILVVMFIVYRMRKKDEGSYALDEPKRSPAAASYGKGQNNREFYA